MPDPRLQRLCGRVARDGGVLGAHLAHAHDAAGLRSTGRLA
jgi:hypothetical protein